MQCNIEDRVSMLVHDKLITFLRTGDDVFVTEMNTGTEWDKMARAVSCLNSSRYGSPEQHPYPTQGVWQMKWQAFSTGAWLMALWLELKEKHKYSVSQNKCQLLQDKEIRGSAVTWCTALQAGRPWLRFPMEVFEIFIDLILPASLWSWVRLSL